MSLTVNFEGLWTSDTKTRLEKALRECVGEPPGDEEWSLAVSSYGRYCIVLVKTAQQTRRKVFFLRAAELAEAIPMWLEQYPLQ